MPPHTLSVPPSLTFRRFRTARAFKALDDGRVQKWTLVVAARNLPRDMPLDANARVPNVLKNQTCAEMRETLLTQPELFQILNGGMVCTATSIHVSQEGNEQWVEIGFDDDNQLGVVNGGHTFGTVLQVVHDNPLYANDQPLKTVLAKKDKAGNNPKLAALLKDDNELADRIARAREHTMVQLEVVAPVSDAILLEKIARARNLSQSVEQTALQNLAGKFDFMKKVLGEAEPPFGEAFVQRVVWKTNQETPEDSTEVPVKFLIHVLALMNLRHYPPGVRTAHEVYARSGVVVREFGEAEEADAEYYDKLSAMLPQFVQLYDHIYEMLPRTASDFPWADGKEQPAGRRRRIAPLTPLFGKPCSTKVSAAFVWPVFSAFRLLLEEGAGGSLHFKTDPIALFEDKKDELSNIIRTFFGRHQMVQMVGKDKEAWLRAESLLDTELKIRERLKA